MLQKHSILCIVCTLLELTLIGKTTAIDENETDYLQVVPQSILDTVVSPGTIQTLRMGEISLTGTNDSVLVFYSNKQDLKNAYHANETCNQLQGYLAHVKTDAVNEVVVNHLERYLENKPGHPFDESFAIGLMRASDDTWQWSDGQNLSDSAPFYPGEPNNYMNREDCVGISTKANNMPPYSPQAFGLWNDNACTMPHRYICQYDYGITILSKKVADVWISNDNITCMGYADDKYITTWMRNGEEVSLDASNRVYQVHEYSAYVQIATVFFSTPLPEQEGTYKCECYLKEDMSVVGSSLLKATAVLQNGEYFEYPPDDVTFMQHNASTYSFANISVLNFDDAKQTCLKLGGYLARLKTTDAAQAVRDHLERYRDEIIGPIAVAFDDKFWIGLERAGPDSWMWTDGTPLEDQQNNENWYESEPNNHQGTEECVGVATKNATWLSHPNKVFGYWNDAECGELQRYICQHPYGSGFISKEEARTWRGHDSIICAAWGNSSYRAEWTRYNEIITGDSLKRIYQSRQRYDGYELSTINFVNTIESDEGNYTCKIMKGEQVLMNLTAHLITKRFFQHLLIRQEHLSETLVCSARGRPLPEIAWHIGNRTLSPSENGDAVRVTESPTQDDLVIESILTVKNRSLITDDVWCSATGYEDTGGLVHLTENATDALGNLEAKRTNFTTAFVHTSSQVNCFFRCRAGSMMPMLRDPRTGQRLQVLLLRTSSFRP